MNHQEIKNALSAYCLGALESDEANVVQAHLAGGCKECRRLADEMLGVVLALPQAADRQEPPSQIKANIVSAIRTTRQAPAMLKPDDGQNRALQTEFINEISHGLRRLNWALVAALVLAMVGFGWYAGSARRDIAALNSRLHISNQLVTQLRSELRSQESMLAIMTSPESETVELAGQPAAPTAKGRVYLDRESGSAVFAAVNLPALPENKDYQLWVLDGPRPVDAGILQLDSSGLAIRQIQDIPPEIDLSAFAVTLEPKGGLPQPTGAMYLLGLVKG